MRITSFLVLIFISFALPMLLSAGLYTQAEPDSLEPANCALVQRLFSEGYNQRNLNMLSEVVAVDYVEQLNGIESKGLISIIKSIKWLEEIAPDFTITIEDVICKKDKVVIRWKYQGTNIEFDKSLTLDGIYIARVEEGKIKKGWQVFDNYQRFSQLGYIITAPIDSTSEGF